MEIVQVIGSYAGFAAIVGLAILSALYFSQARDVRRLREWAGRAPERASQQESTVTPGSQPAAAASGPGAAQPGGAQQPVPASAPVPAVAPGGAVARTGDAVTASGAPAPAPPAGPAKPAVAAVAAANNATATQAAPASTPDAPASAPASGTQGGGTATTPHATGPPALPGAVPLGADRAAASPPAGRLAPPGAAAPRRVPQPSPVAAPERQPWYLRLAPRYIILIVAGVLIVGGGVAYGLTRLSTDASPAQRSAAPAAEEEGDGAASPQAPVDRGQVTVSVLNGTTVPGLARRVSDDLREAGFRRGRTDNATEQARAESVVFYADGSERAARAVGEELGIGQRQPITGDARALAGNAEIVVVLGADKM